MSFVDRIIYCTQCGKGHAADSKFCSQCGTALNVVSCMSAEETNVICQRDNIVRDQIQTISFPEGFEFKKFCANCGKKLSISGKTKIAGKMYICESCLAGCGKSVEHQIKDMTIADVKNAIACMNRYPEFALTHQFADLLIDVNNGLWKVAGYPTYRIDDIIDFEAIEERETESISHTQAKTKKKGGLGGAVVGGVLFGVPGAVVGGMAGRKSVSVGNTRTTNIEYFTKLGVRIIINDINIPTISVHFLNGRKMVARSQKIVNEVNNVLAFLNVITRK